MSSRARRPRKVFDESALRAYKYQSVASVANTAIRYGGLLGIVYFGVYRPVEALAGRVTFADVGVELLASVGVDKWPAWLVAVGAMIYGWRERKLRQRNIERMGGHVQRLESKRDRKRTSSNLTRKGRTNPGDEI